MRAFLYDARECPPVTGQTATVDRSWQLIQGVLSRVIYRNAFRFSDQTSMTGWIRIGDHGYQDASARCIYVCRRTGSISSNTPITTASVPDPFYSLPLNGNVSRGCMNTDTLAEDVLYQLPEQTHGVRPARPIPVSNGCRIRAARKLRIFRRSHYLCVRRAARAEHRLQRQARDLHDAGSDVRRQLRPAVETETCVQKVDGVWNAPGRRVL